MRHTKKQLKSSGLAPSQAIIPLHFTPPEQGTQQLYWREKVWYCLFRIPGERVPHRISMGTDDEIEARRRAQAEFIKLQARLSSGKPRREVTFRFVASKLIEELEAEREARAKYGERRPDGEKLRHPHTLIKKINHISRYLIPHFGDKEVQDITDDDLKAAKNKFATYWTEGEGKDIKEWEVMRNGRLTTITRRELGNANRNTLNTYVMSINEVFKFAKSRYGTSPKLTKTAYTEREDNARASITPVQWEKLIQTQEARIAAEKREHHKWRLRRVLLGFEWILHSGLRVAELHSMRWGDIEVVGNGFTLQLHNVASKGKPIRSVLCRSEIMPVYRELLARRRTSDPNEYVFSNEFDPMKKCSMLDGAQVLLQKAKLWADGKGGYRTMGSMRHSYTIAMIHNMAPFNLFKLATNLGTSEKQIRRHYAADIDLRDGLEQMAGIDTGLTGSIFEIAGKAPKQEPPNPYLSDAREMIRVWAETEEDWRSKDDAWMASEIRNSHGEYTYNLTEIEMFVRTIRALAAANEN